MLDVKGCVGVTIAVEAVVVVVGTVGQQVPPADTESTALDHASYCVRYSCVTTGAGTRDWKYATIWSAVLHPP